MCKDCKNNCLEESVDKCILYTGPDFVKFGIKKGEYYDKVIVDLLTELQRICDETVDLSCLYTGKCDTCEPQVKIPKAVQVIIDKICSLNSSEIKYTGDRYCIGDSSISAGAVRLLGKTFRYDVQPAAIGTAVSYDLTDIISSLPSNYRIGRINTVISGKPKNGKSIILDSDKSTIGANIDNDRFPINLDIDFRVATPSGDVKLVKRLSIPTPLSGSYSASMNVQDFGTEAQEEYSLESFLEGMAGQACANKTELDSLKNIDLPGCEEIQYTSKDIRDIIAQHNSILCSILDRLNSLENVSYSSCSTGCDPTSKTGTAESAINSLASTCCGIISDVQRLSRDVQTLGDIQTSNSANNGSGGLITNGGIGGGSCPGGNCGSTTPNGGTIVIPRGGGGCSGGNCG